MEAVCPAASLAASCESGPPASPTGIGSPKPPDSRAFRRDVSAATASLELPVSGEARRTRLTSNKGPVGPPADADDVRRLPDIRLNAATNKTRWTATDVASATAPRARLRVLVEGGDKTDPLSTTSNSRAQTADCLHG